MIEKEFNDRIYTKSTAKREKYTIFMLQNIGLFPLLDSATHVRIQKNASGTSSSPEASIKTAATYSPTVTQYHRRDKA